MTATRRTNHLITIDGETETLAEWVRRYKDSGITRPLVLGRLRAGWSEEDAVTTPPRKYATNQERATVDD